MKKLKALMLISFLAGLFLTSHVYASTPPDTSIISAVDGNGMGIANGGLALSNTTTFTFAGTDDTGISGFECTFLPPDPFFDFFFPCSNPHTFSNLPFLTHTLRVRAVDLDGNRDPTPATFTWSMCPGGLTAGTRVTLDFSCLPGPDGQMSTVDDMPFTSNDILFACGPAGCGARIIDEEYASLGVHFSGAAALGAIGGGFNLDGSSNTTGFNLLLENVVITDEVTGATSGIAPTSIHFDVPQTEITFDLFAFIQQSGTAAPLMLKDSNGNIISTLTLTCANAILGPCNPFQLGGRFKITSAIPFRIVDFGLTLPANGGFGIENLNFETLLQILSVAIDMKPGSLPNSINLKSKGNVPVAIFSETGFDVTTIDQTTVRFAGASPVRTKKSFEDINADGLPDLVLHFGILSLNLTPSDTKACLTGQTLSGQEFAGCDSVRMVK